MAEVYVTADLHLGHEKVIGYENRPFNSAEEMDIILTANWNGTVNKRDTIIVLGDVVFRKNKEQTAEAMRKLRGTKWLVMGNHDLGRSGQWWRDVGFAEVYKFPILYKKHYLLSHAPSEHTADTGLFNIHGHLHSKTLDSAQHINVGVERTNYRPVPIQSIMGKFNEETFEAARDKQIPVRA